MPDRFSQGSFGKVAIIGAGPGGYVTAIRLNQYRINTVVIEKERLGGVCLNWGCIPTKTLVKNANLFYEIKESKKFGVNIDNIQLDWQKVKQRKEKIKNQLINGVEYLFKRRNIPLVKREVKEIHYEKDKIILICVDKDNKLSELTSKYLIIATGSQPKELPDIKIDNEYILDSKGLLDIDELPEHLTIIGGGVIGCEFASIFHNFGSKVEIVEFMPNLIPGEDKEVVNRLAQLYKRKKIKIHLNTKVEKYEKINGKVKLSLSNGKEIILRSRDKVLLSVGREPYFTIETSPEISRQVGTNNSIEVDEYLETNLRNVFAIGDVTGKLMLAHSASKQGMLVAETIRNREQGIQDKPNSIIYENIPRCVFSEPEVGCVGLTEEQAREQYNNIIIGKFPFIANGKALSLDKADGFAKLVFDKESQALLGAHFIGPMASELVAQGAILINSKMSLEQMKDIVFAHPTLSEALGESIEDLESLAIHKM